MRTIKFRGKKKSGEWLYGDLMHYCGATLILPLDANWYDFVPKKDNPLRLPSSKFEVDPATVGQFVGLMDKNGREIYEGDIIIGEIDMDFINGDYRSFDYKGSVIFENGQYIENDYGTSLEFLMRQINKPEIIGNIYDNPELLKGGEV